MPKKRVSMSGMGADAFFGPPAEEVDEKEVSQDTSTPVSLQTNKEATQQIDIPVEQLSSKEIYQDTSTQKKHLTGTEVKQDTSKTVNQETSGEVKLQVAKEVHQDTSTPAYVKVSYYITSEQDLKLEQIRLQRRMQGVKVDKSELVREAIDLLELSD